MAVSWKWIIELLAKALGPIMGLLTPLIASVLKGVLIDLYKKALVTSNPWDDFMVGLLLDILGIDRPTPDIPII